MTEHVVTVTDIARELELSPSTVSRALRDTGRIGKHTRERVCKAAKELGYVPNVHAQRLLGGPVKTIGMCCSQGLSIPHPDYYMLELRQSVVNAATRIDYSIEILNTGDALKLHQMLAAREMDGLIIITDNPYACSRLARQLAPYPCVLVGMSLKKLRKGLSVVALDRETGAREATEHLLQLGHRRIGFIRGVPGNPRRDDKYEGYATAMKSAGLKADSKLIVSGGATIEGAMAAAEHLLEKRVTATLCETDWIALGHIQIARASGIRVPDDLSIVGFNDCAFSAYLSPPLTTVRIPRAELGEAAVSKLLRLIQGETKGERVTVGTQLVCRGSTAPPPRA